MSGDTRIINTDIQRRNLSLLSFGSAACRFRNRLATMMQTYWIAAKARQAEIAGDKAALELARKSLESLRNG